MLRFHLRGDPGIQNCLSGPGPQEERTMPPTKLAHLVYQTNRMAEMRDWY